MTWQDELQQLDDELAAGRISAEEYRTRRDALGGTQQGHPGTPAGGIPQSGGQAGGQQGGRQGPPPGTPSGGFPQPQQQPQAQQPNPFPPAFNWGEAAAQGARAAASEESTQQVQHPFQPQSGWQQQGWSQQQSGWGPQQGWAPTESSGTPWGDRDMPPEHGDTSWMRQGPEVFETAGKSSRGKLIAGVSIAGVLVVGVVVATIFYSVSRSEERAAPAPVSHGRPPAPAPPPIPPTPKLPEAPAAKPAPPATAQEVLIASPPGPPHQYNGLLDRPSLEGVKRGVLPDPARDFALQHGMVDGWINRTDGPPAAVLMAVRLPDEAGASGLAQSYLDNQKGLAESDELSYQGVQVVTTGNGTFRTAYVSHNSVVFVEVTGPQEQTRPEFKDLLARQLAQSPPTVRK